MTGRDFLRGARPMRRHGTSTRSSAGACGRVARALACGTCALLIAGVTPTSGAAAGVTGAAVAWGDNSVGQLGNDSRTDRRTPVQVSGLTSGVASLRAGAQHSLALTSAGSVWAWGSNSSDQLGDGTHTASSVPVAVSGLASGVTAIAAGFDHSLALRSNGSVVGWGYNGFGQVGDGTAGAGGDVTKPLPVQVVGLTSGVVAVSAGEYHSLALKSDGSVVAWGSNSWGQLGDGSTTDRHTPVRVSGLSNVVAIAAGGTMSAAVTSTGAVFAWGDNTYGEIGDGTTTTPRATPRQVSGLTSGVVAISTGRLHTLALTSSGSVVAWGANWTGQIGDNSTTNRLLPVPVNGLDHGVTSIAAGSDHSLALRADGSVVAWGSNSAGQLGDTSTVNRWVPTAMTGTTSAIRAIAGGGVHSVAIATDPLPPDPPQPMISVSSASTVEGTTTAPSKPTSVLVFRVRLSAPSTFPVGVQVSTHDGTAQSTTPRDFLGKVQTLNIPPGERTAVFKVKVYPDAANEPDETLSVTLSNPNNADISMGTATGTIQNDD